MKIYKFGGASVKNADAVRNVANIIAAEQQPLIIVVSAMGKITNLLEEICNAYFYHTADPRTHIETLRTYHNDIIRDLFTDPTAINTAVETLINELTLITNAAPSLSYDYEYDRIVSFGERISTTIVSAYLNNIGTNNQLIDIRHAIKTDDNYRDANINMQLSEKCAKTIFTFKNNTTRYLTQGFIAGTLTNQTTTLGREGSDYTAAVLANLLQAESVTIWKDVPGVMNADPKQFPEAQIMPHISYKEAVELSHCGAQIIHPKTIKPLQNKGIKLHVKSFLNPTAPGTVIEEINTHIDIPPIYILKPNQLLLTLTPNDFSFVAEEKLSHICATLAKYRLHLHLLQQSAINFTILIDHNPQNFQQLLDELRTQYEIRYNQNVTLLTIRHYTEQAIATHTNGKNILVEQRSRLMAQYALTDKQQ